MGRAFRPVGFGRDEVALDAGGISEEGPDVEEDAGLLAESVDWLYAKVLEGVGTRWRAGDSDRSSLIGRAGLCGCIGASIGPRCGDEDDSDDGEGEKSSGAACPGSSRLSNGDMLEPSTVEQREKTGHANQQTAPRLARYEGR
jgi:hypothetical protein